MHSPRAPSGGRVDCQPRSGFGACASGGCVLPYKPRVKDGAPLFCWRRDAATALDFEDDWRRCLASQKTKDERTQNESGRERSTVDRLLSLTSAEQNVTSSETVCVRVLCLLPPLPAVGIFGEGGIRGVYFLPWYCWILLLGLRRRVSRYPKLHRYKKNRSNTTHPHTNYACGKECANLSKQSTNLISKSLLSLQTSNRSSWLCRGTSRVSASSSSSVTLGASGCCCCC